MNLSMFSNLLRRISLGCEIGPRPLQLVDQDVIAHGLARSDSNFVSECFRDNRTIPSLTWAT